MIKLLKPRVICVGKLHCCGDGCCSWTEYETELLEIGEEIEENSIAILDFNEMVENIDYVYITN